MNYSIITTESSLLLRSPLLCHDQSRQLRNLDTQFLHLIFQHRIAHPSSRRLPIRSLVCSTQRRVDLGRAVRSVRAPRRIGGEMLRVSFPAAAGQIREEGSLFLGGGGVGAGDAWAHGGECGGATSDLFVRFFKDEDGCDDWGMCYLEGDDAGAAEVIC